jgi:ubiquitin-conjugating enzyme E2 Z
MRIKNELVRIVKDPPFGIMFIQDETRATTLHPLITGPTGTPYEGGFFYFLVRCPPATRIAHCELFC